MTRLEVEIGLIQRNDRNLKTLAFFREIENMPLQSANEYIKDFSEEDNTTKELVNKLKEEAKIALNDNNKLYFQVGIVFEKSVLLLSNFRLFKIDWAVLVDNLNNENKYTDHIKDYLKKFGEGFQIKVKDLVLSNFEKNPIIRIDAEILHHAGYCEKLNSKLKNDILNEKVIIF